MIPMNYISKNNKWFGKCPICKGAGENVDFVNDSGRVPICACCDGRGIVPSEKLDELIEALVGLGYIQKRLR